jgi:hypothetical protein
MATQVFILVRHDQDDTEIVAVFESAEALHKRVLSWIDKGDYTKLAGLEMMVHPVMTS